MKVDVDARGVACPHPVIQTKKALENLKEGRLVTVVDNNIAKENVKKLAKSLNMHHNVMEQDGFFYIEIFKGEGMGAEIMGEQKPSLQDLVILFATDKLGQGDDTLGEVLMKGYIYSLTECKPYPKALLFINSAVNLTVEGSSVLENLRDLEKLGVEILSCGTCLDFFHLKDKLGVGGVTNMYSIVEITNGAKNTIKW